MALQSRQPLPRIPNLSYPQVSILPEVEEFLVMLYGFASPVYLEVWALVFCGISILRFLSLGLISDPTRRVFL